MNPKDVEPRMQVLAHMIKTEAPKGEHGAVDAMTQLIGGALVDLGRIANALEQIAESFKAVERIDNRQASERRRPS